MLDINADGVLGLDFIEIAAPRGRAESDCGFYEPGGVVLAVESEA